MNTNSDFVSIIMTTYSSNGMRSKFLRESIMSLLETVDYPCEIVVIDNGGSKEDSRMLLDLNEKGLIHSYVRNAQNMHFGYARSQGLQLVNGDYIAIVDNDIMYKPKWLSTCLSVLKAYPRKKIYATPIWNRAHNHKKYWQGDLKVGDKNFRLNLRAGSNCWVTRRSDFEKIGRFLCHRVAGTKWTNKAVRMGYLAAVTPEKMIVDMGFKRGYNLNDPIPVKRVLSDGTEVHFNHDEWGILNQKKDIILQKILIDPEYAKNRQ